MHFSIWNKLAGALAAIVLGIAGTASAALSEKNTLELPLPSAESQTTQAKSVQLPIENEVVSVPAPTEELASHFGYYGGYGYGAYRPSYSFSFGYRSSPFRSFGLNYYRSYYPGYSFYSPSYYYPGSYYGYGYRPSYYGMSVYRPSYYGSAYYQPQYYGSFYSPYYSPYYSSYYGGYGYGSYGFGFGF